MRRLAIETQRFEFAMRSNQKRAAWRFVRAARLHSYETIFDDVHAAYAIRRGDFIQLIEKCERRELLSVHGNRRAGLETDFDCRGLVGGLRRRDDPLPHGFLGRICGIFENAAFMAQVPDIAVAAVNILGGLLDGNVVLAERRRLHLRAS